MIEHHIQKTIVYSLAHAESMRFSELKPDGVENKLFDYHLKIVIRDGYVEKDSEGNYSLSAEGRRMWMRANKHQDWFAELAYSVIFMVIRRQEDGAWLLAKRKTHPLFDMTGFIHATPEHDRSISETAQIAAKQKTGLDCNFKYLGSGYLKIFKDEDMESFTHFNLVVCDDAQGELIAEDDLASYSWLEDPSFTANEMIPNMKILSDAYLSGELFFIEETIRY